MDQDGGEHDEREELEELRLPVLEGGLAEFHDEPAGLDGLVVGSLLVRIRLPLGDALTDPAHEEEGAEGDAEPEVGSDPADLGAPALPLNALDGHGDQREADAEEDHEREPDGERLPRGRSPWMDDRFFPIDRAFKTRLPAKG